MADFTDVIEVNYVPELEGDTNISVVSLFTSDDPGISTFFQRIYDTGVGGYVYYTLESVTATPDVADTTPNHTNNLVAATHEVIKEN